MKPEFSIVIPVYNEESNVGPLTDEITQALAERRFEVLYVDDGSTDGTLAALQEARRAQPALRIVRHSRRGGQSAALCTGIRLARADWVATLDGDGQNDPADISRLIAARDLDPASPVRLYIGHRTQRRDTWLRRISSRVANGLHSRLLHDSTPDSRCGITLVHRDTFMELPRFDHMHRFLPALMQRQGAGVESVPVHHRERRRGLSGYGRFDPLRVGIADLFGVMWLTRRYRGGIGVKEE